MRASGKSKGWNILLVEDNAADVRLMREVLKQGARHLNLHVAGDGEQALAMLAREPEPDLVLLDLNLPGLPGREVLARMKADARLKHIPVIVLSTSRSDADVAACYQLHANCYLQKPMDVERFASAMRQLEEFWLTQVALPPKGAREYRVG
jgi:two-component system, chemotaxis family, response regulator Rcp1